MTRKLSRKRGWRGPAVVAVVALLAAGIDTSASAQRGVETPWRGSAASRPRCPTTPHEPCKGPIEVVTTYSGYKEGPLSLIKLTLGPSRKIAGEELEGGGTRHEIDQRQVSWHSVANVEVVAVFILHRPKLRRFVYQAVPTGKHSGHTTLTDLKEPGVDYAQQIVIVQGRKV